MRWALLGLLGLAVVLLVLNHDSGRVGGLENADFARLTWGIVVLVSLGGSLLVMGRGRFGEMARHAAIWVGVLLGLIGLYAYKDEALGVTHRVFGVLIPGYVVPTTEPGVVQVMRAGDGHFQLNGLVNGVRVRMVVDTGASMLVLTQQAARAAGLDPDRLDYSFPISTANGRTSAARVMLNSLALGPIRFTRVEAMVARPGALEATLLGMNVLDRLASYSVEGDRMVLRR